MLLMPFVSVKLIHSIYISFLSATLLPQTVVYCALFKTATVERRNIKAEQSHKREMKNLIKIKKREIYFSSFFELAFNERTTNIFPLFLFRFHSVVSFLLQMRRAALRYASQTIIIHGHLEWNNCYLPEISKWISYDIRLNEKDSFNFLLASKTLVICLVTLNSVAKFP